MACGELHCPVRVDGFIELVPAVCTLWVLSAHGVVVSTAIRTHPPPALAGAFFRAWPSAFPALHGGTEVVKITLLHCTVLHDLVVHATRTSPLVRVCVAFCCESLILQVQLPLPRLLDLFSGC